MRNMEHKDNDPEKTQPNPDGQEMYEMLFGKPAKAPLVGLRQFTINHLFANVWSRSRPPVDETRMISLKERSMITVALLAGQGRSEELESHIRGALHQGLSKEQVLEIMIHVAHYAGWPAGNSGQRVAMKVFEQQTDS
jgi:alkylhydroperoxidase/carboxymuconolactone decarboxylase family protein YurZ